MRKRIKVIGLVTAVFVVGVVLGHTPTASSEQVYYGQQLTHFRCYNILEGATNPPHTVALGDQFGTEVRPVGLARMFCAPAFKTIVSGPPAEPPTGVEDHLKCYVFNGQHTPPRLDLHNQLGRETNVLLNRTGLICVPTSKIILPR